MSLKVAHRTDQRLDGQLQNATESVWNNRFQLDILELLCIRCLIIELLENLTKCLSLFDGFIYSNVDFCPRFNGWHSIYGQMPRYIINIVNPIRLKPNNMMLRQKLFAAMAAVFAATAAVAGSLDDIRRALEVGSVNQLQEKVYVHTDNNCYFVGDTLWYKAYVVRADDLRPTDMSRILYVELLSPDGLLVERQNIIVSPTGFTCGAFALKDSLYSGYYELRAYTRWMLNFNATEVRHSRDDTHFFYNEAMASDYFRQWDGLYSRVLPIYEQPDSAGDYTYKRIYPRPKQRLPKQLKPELTVTFYPEGGHLVEGVDCRVAFEAVDQEGAAVTISGMVDDGKGLSTPLSTTHLGRGVFTVRPGRDRLKATFTWDGKEYTFPLPKAERSGVALRLDGDTLTVTPHGLADGAAYGLSVLCRGSLRHFEEVSLAEGVPVRMALPPLPTGVNDVTVFDSEGRILADRLFFVNNQDYGAGLVTVDGMGGNARQPYERIDLALQSHVGQATLSVSVRDTRTDEPTYDDGNIMTDMLLSSELRGFVAHPAYYFEADDAAHRSALDLLMMVQGWRKYKWEELSDTLYNHRRYQPELSMTVEGAVYKMLSINEVTAEELDSWKTGQGLVARGRLSDDDESSSDDTAVGGTSSSDLSEIGVDQDRVSYDNSDIVYGDIGSANAMLGVNHGSLKREVLVEAELMLDGNYASIVQRTHNRGLFGFEIPPYYGVAVLNMKAYNEKDSLKKAISSTSDRNALNEDAYPDYYVKRDLPYPVFTKPYSYYQNHAPEEDYSWNADTTSLLSMENDVYQLRNIDVRGRRRGKRAIDFDKPAFVIDAYQLYNDITDRGLSFGKVDMRMFPLAVSRYLYGNLGRYNYYNVDGKLNGIIYYRNYTPDTSNPGVVWDNRNVQALYNTLKLKRLKDVRVFTDYEPREVDSTIEQDYYKADVTVELVALPDDGRRFSSRDRHIMLPGFNLPADFYSPDYSQATPAEPVDHRRTLYWNPNAATDEDGRLNITLYNNSHPTRIAVSVAGVTADGQLLYF